jgi:hypothetical protein
VRKLTSHHGTSGSVHTVEDDKACINLSVLLPNLQILNCAICSSQTLSLPSNVPIACARRTGDVEWGHRPSYYSQFISHLPYNPRSSTLAIGPMDIPIGAGNFLPRKPGIFACDGGMQMGGVLLVEVMEG